MYIHNALDFFELMFFYCNRIPHLFIVELEIPKSKKLCDKWSEF